MSAFTHTHLHTQHHWLCGCLFSHSVLMTSWFTMSLNSRSNICQCFKSNACQRSRLACHGCFSSRTFEKNVAVFYDACVACGVRLAHLRLFSTTCVNSVLIAAHVDIKCALSKARCAIKKTSADGWAEDATSTLIVQSISAVPGGTCGVAVQSYIRDCSYSVFIKSRSFQLMF